MYTYAAVDGVDCALACGTTARVETSIMEAAKPRARTAYVIEILPFVM
jgi:hypothetical protein